MQRSAYLHSAYPAVCGIQREGVFFLIQYEYFPQDWNYFMYWTLIFSFTLYPVYNEVYIYMIHSDTI